MSQPLEPESKPGWREAIAIYAKPRVASMAFLGFSSGLPFLLVFSTLTAWLRDNSVSHTEIGFFAWVGITYSIKVLWAPVIDRLEIPLVRRLGKRRSWMLAGQLGIACGLMMMSTIGPTNLVPLSLAALLVAFSSSTQDIAIDAYRIEAVVDEYQGAMSASYIFGYRVGLLAAGAGALYIAQFLGWVAAYQTMALLVAVGVITVMLVSEPDHRAAADSVATEQRVVDYLTRNQHRPEWLRRLQAWFIGAVVCPFVEFFERNGRFALVVLLFIGVFRLSDIAMGIMANPFYLDMGYSKAEIASVAKIFGFFMSIAGSAICGVLVVRWGIMKPLLVGAIAVASTNLLFAVLATLKPEIRWLAMVISADNISGGFAATAFVAYLSSLTNRSYTATQYALFSSLMTLPGKFISGFSGVIVDDYGYVSFFVFAAVIGIPAILLVLTLMRHERAAAST
ncbi:MAG TPA: MFS transporter [Pseudomonadales bacterium]|nr:MFS transporter [Pseudomonadales bacterium]